MSYNRRTDYRAQYPSSRLSYDEPDERYDSRDRTRNNRTYRDHDDTTAKEWSHDRYTDGTNAVKHHDQSGSPYYSSNHSRSQAGRSRSRSPEGRGSYGRTPPRDSTGRWDYYDRDDPSGEHGASAGGGGGGTGEYYAGEPSRDVILEGIALDMEDDDINQELVKYGVEGLNTVTLIRERKTGISRGFAFARFLSLPDSKLFMDTHYPAIDLGERCPRVRLAYSKERDENAVGADDWTCRMCLLSNYPRRTACFRCGAARSDGSTGALTQAPPSSFSNDGAKDASDTPSQFLLFRNLDPVGTEEVLLKGALKLSSGPLAIKRVLLVRDRRTNESWRFGFAEFVSLDEAKVAYNNFLATAGGFTISSKPVTASYIHPGVIVPVFKQRPGGERWTFEPMSSMSGGIRLAYWDEEGYVSVLLAEGAKNAAEDSPLDAKEKKAKKKEKDALDVLASEKPKKRKAETTLTKDAIANKKMQNIPSHLQFWQNRHEELHTGKKAALPSESYPSKPTEENAPPQKSYADLTKLCCYLCSRQFKTEAEVNKHERISALHRTNLDNQALVTKAEAKMAKVKSASAEAMEDDTYRDRAKERRQIHQQPANPGSALGQQRRVVEKAPSPEPVVVNKGASLLSKMGWTEGKGLGAEEAGRVAPVVAEMYAQGVGLGAAGGKIGDVNEGTPGGDGGYKGFVQRTKDKAQQRYEELNR